MGGIVSGIGSIVGAVTKNTGAPQEAASARTGANRKAQQIFQETQEATEERFSPFIDTGLEGFEQFAEGSTAGGFIDVIRQLSDSGVLDPLIEERERGVQSQLSAGGLTRSGAGVQALSAVRPQTLFDIESLLSTRSGRLGDVGFQGAGQLSNLAQVSAANRAGLESDIGAFRAQGILGQEQARQDRNDQLFGGISNVSQGAGQAATGGFGSLFL